MSTQAAVRRCDPAVMELNADIAVLWFTRIPLFAAADLQHKTRILKCLEQAAGDPSIRVLVIMGSPEKSGSTEYVDFFRAAAESDDRLLSKMLNAFNQMILQIARTPKPVISADSGTVLSQFLHMTLACDYRIVSDNTVFQKAYLAENMVPKGGGAFFLRRLVGPAKAFEILTSEEDMTAGEALALGLVNEVVPFETLTKTAMARAHKMARIPPQSAAGIKKLLSYPLRELEEYLEAENEELYRAFIHGRYPAK
jgi:2-(1,2-epoxy-1,2-dihydrophenyl)acetyl-CoA isomerase